MGSLLDKYELLVDRLRAMDRVSVAFSGGVDSSLLAHAAFEALGQNALAVTVDTEFTSRAAMDRARRVAAHIGLPHRIMELNLLESVPELCGNPPERCYLCKRAVLGIMPGPGVAEGTNADDDPKRPGRRAVAELGAASPLAEAGLAKAQVRDLAARLGLPNAHDPSDSCLATRLPCPGSVTPALLADVEKMENLVHSLGAPMVRARPRSPEFVLDLPETARPTVESHRIILEKTALELGYSRVAIRYFNERTGKTA